MANVNAFDRLGGKINIPEDQVPDLIKMGGRLPTPDDIAQHTAEVKEQQLNDAYDKSSTLQKVGGVASDVLGPFASNTLSATGVTSNPPAVESFKRGMTEFATGGMDEALARQALQQVSPDVAKRYAEHLDDVKATFPASNTAGQIVGAAALLAGGNAGGGAAKIIPGVGVSALGEGAEIGVGRVASALGHTGETVLGRAALSGAKFGARNAVEAAALSGLQEGSDQILHDDPFNGEKIFSAVGHGAAVGGATGAVLGSGGSLVASGAKAGFGAATKFVLSKVGRAAAEGEAEAASSAARGASEEARAAENIHVNTEPQKGLYSGARQLASPDDLVPHISVEGGGAVEGNAAKTAAKKAVAEEMHGEVVTPAAPPTAAEAAKMPPQAESFSAKAEAKSRKYANDLAFQSLGAKGSIPDKINAKVEGGTNSIGDYILRRVIKKDAGLFDTALNSSRVDQLLPKIESELAADGAKIGEEIKAYPTRVNVSEIFDPAIKIHDAMLKDPTAIQGAEAFQKRIQSMFKAMDNAGQIRGNWQAGEGTIGLSDMYYARSKLEAVVHELGHGSAAATSFKEYLRAVDDHLVSKLDDAAKLAGQEGGSRIKALKKEYQLGSWAKRAAEDGASRVEKNNPFPLAGSIAGLGGIAMGHPIGGVAVGFGAKLLKERGKLLGAKALSDAAEAGYVAKAAAFVDEKVKAAAQGVLREGKAAPREEVPKPRGRPRKEAEADPFAGREAQKQTVREGNAIVKRITEAQANPEAFERQLEESAATIQKTAGPQTAMSFVQTALRAQNFLTSVVPVKPRLNPLDPNSQPPLTFDEAQKVIKANTYVTQPMTVWQELENGEVTPLNVRAAKTIMPESFNSFVMHMYDVLDEKVQRNVQLSQTQALNTYRILGIPVSSDLRAEMVKRYQVNYTDGSPGTQDPNAGPPPMGKSIKPDHFKPVDMKIANSGFDQIEARKTK